MGMTGHVKRTQPPPITAPELAALTGYDISTICRWARDGHIPTIRKLPGLRGAWLFDPGVQQMIASKLPPAGAGPDHPPAGVHR